MSGPPPPMPDVNLNYKQEREREEGRGKREEEYSMGLIMIYDCLFLIYVVHCIVIYIPPSLEASDPLSSLLASRLHSSSSGIAPTPKCPV